MLRRRSVAFIPVAVVALLGGIGVFSVSAAPPTGTDASEVTHWNQVAASTLIAIPGPGGGAPPHFQINMGMVQGAVYDAVNAIGPKTASAVSARDSRRCQGVDRRRCRNGGVRRALKSRLDRHPRQFRSRVVRDSWRRSSRSATHRSVRSPITPSRSRASRSGTLRPRPCSTRGWATDVSGRLNGAERPASESGCRSTIRRPGAAPRSDPLGGRREAVPHPELRSSSAARHRRRSTARSGRLSSTRSRASGRATGSTRNDSTDQQTYKAKWWQSAPGLSWNEVARQLITRNNLDAADAARLLALQNLSGADAAINCWNDKYHFDFWRPWNAITTTLDDGNAGTTTDASWTALITAPYPEWVSGHNCLDTAQVTVLRLFFGDAPGNFHDHERVHVPCSR